MTIGRRWERCTSPRSMRTPGLPRCNFVLQRDKAHCLLTTDDWLPSQQKLSAVGPKANPAHRLEQQGKPWTVSVVLQRANKRVFLAAFFFFFSFSFEPFSPLSVEKVIPWRSDLLAKCCQEGSGEIKSWVERKFFFLSLSLSVWDCLLKDKTILADPLGPRDAHRQSTCDSEIKRKKSSENNALSSVDWPDTKNNNIEQCVHYVSH